jgi:glycosyltransferase involved in cell wall biosynthesis
MTTHGAASLRVVLLGHSAAPSGAELGLTELISALDEVECHVILAEDGPVVDLLARQGVSTEVLPLGAATRRFGRHRVAIGSVRAAGAGIDATAYGVRLAKRLRALRPDLVDAHTLKALLYGTVATRLARTPLLWHLHDRLADDYLPPAAGRLVRAVARRGTCGIVANSKATLSTVGTMPVPLRVIPEPVAGGSARRRARGSDEPFTVGIVGRIAPWKGQDVFVRAFAQAFPGGAERAVIVGAPLFGEDAYLHRLETLVGDLGLAGRVELAGFRSDVPTELGRFDALVHASVIPEPFGRVVVEGMAAGLPVVAADAGGPREVISSGRDGLLYPPGDVPALADALRLVARDAELGARLGDAAVESAKLYTPERVARQTAAFYREVLAGRRAAA